VRVAPGAEDAPAVGVVLLGVEDVPLPDQVDVGGRGRRVRLPLDVAHTAQVHVQLVLLDSNARALS
jgi:hypothetical protein